MRHFLKLSLQATALALTLSTTLSAVAQEEYPAEPIRILVGVSPGASTNHVARLVAERLQEGLGQPVVVENRPGANTAIATEAVNRADPDGYTLLFATNAHITVPLLSEQRYDPLKNFTPIGTVGITRFVMSVNPSVPADTLQEFIAYAKENPDRLNFGSSGSGGTSHLAGEKFNMLTDVNIQHIPYKGGGPALTGLLGGEVQVSYGTPMLVTPHIEAGKLKPLAVTGPQRNAALPDVPTFAEAGLPEYEQSAWWGLYAPAGVPQPIADKLATELNKVLSSSDFSETLENQGIEPFISTPEEFMAMMEAESDELEQLINAVNITLN